MNLKLKQIDRWISTLLLFSIMIITFVQIALRELFELPMVGVEEFTRYLFIAVIFVGLPYAYRTDGHIRLKGVWNTFPDKVQRIIDIIIELSSLIALSVIAVSAIYTTVTNFHSTTLTLSIPFWLFFLPTCMGFTMLVIEHFKLFIKMLRKKS